MGRLVKAFRIFKRLREMDARIKDLERHFVTKRDSQGTPTETLADVPIEKRKAHQPTMRGLSWPQRRALLEQTEGGRIIAHE